MTFKVIVTKSFNKNLRDFLGKGDKKIVQAVRAAMTEAGMSGDIKSIPRTKHGESRITNVEKYDLPDAYRLVVQLVNGVEKSRAFLFVGNHADSEHWLDAHKNYKWVKKETDGALDFVLVTGPEDGRHIPADRLDLESPEELIRLPLLRKLTEEDWKVIAAGRAAQDFAKKISGEEFESDADSLFDKLDELAGYEKASLLFDLIWLSHSGEWQGFQQRLDVIRGGAAVVESEVAAEAMASVDNSESFITFDDSRLLDDFLSKNTLSDWMLFMHPDQKIVSERDFRGPARLRGVSGSGKTCVLVHRARNLAKKYGEPVLLVTLTESMRRLLDRLADDLCGVERSLIETKTMSMLAKDVLSLSRGTLSSFQMMNADTQDRVIDCVAKYLKSIPGVEGSVFRSMGFSDLCGFLRDEISYVRGRLRDSYIERYLDPKVFQRAGRGTSLSQTDRKFMLEAFLFYMQKLRDEHLQDHEGVVMSAISELETGLNSSCGKFRCVLSDEIQDLSELDVTLLSMLRTPKGEIVSKVENGFFLAGDGAQSIYKRGFSLRRIGVDVVGRSISLKKNYRNTQEILQAAFGLVSQYEFADVDEENVARPSTPDFAKRHGAKPLLVRCGSIEEEARYIARQVQFILTIGQTPGQICVIGPNGKTREEIKKYLDEIGIQSIELRQDVDYESDNVKISTIESAKGHEFSCVFIMGVVEGVLPFSGVHSGELSREAARLYVAMTRAREKLTITYSPTAGHPASRLLSAIQNDCDEAHLRNGEVRKLS